MVENDEDLLKGARPVVEPSGGQKVAGMMLRVFGLFVFLVGGVLTMGCLVGLMFEPLYEKNTEGLLWLMAIGLGGTGTMVLGALMGAFGTVLAGMVRTVRGSGFAWWAIAAAGRNTLIVTGVGMLFCAAFVRDAGREWVVVAGVVLLGLAMVAGAFGLNRVMNRIQLSGNVGGG